MSKFKITTFENKNLIKQTEYSEPSYDINQWCKTVGGSMLNTTTGEVRECIRDSLSPRNMDSIEKSLSNINSMILNSFNPEEETVYSIDFTYRKPPKEYDVVRKDFTNVKRTCKRIDDDVKLLIYIELGKSQNYHGHAFLSHIELNEEMFRNIWKKGDQIMFQIVKTDDDLAYKADYLTNISPDYPVSAQKRKNIAKFPVGKRLIVKTNNVYPGDEITSSTGVDRTNKRVILETPEQKANRRGLRTTTFKEFDEMAA